jgi:hypothetical protein
MATPDIRQQALKLPHSSPTGYYTTPHHHNTQLQTSRPDVTLLHTTPKGEPTITLIELIFCRDIDYQPRLNKATTQHKHECKLVTYLDSLGYKRCNCNPLLIGIGGAIFNIHTTQALRDLGLPKPIFQKICRNLHKMALNCNNKTSQY